MSERNSSVSNALTYAVMGLIAGIVFGAVFWVVGEYGANQAIFAGIVVALVVTVLLGIILGGGSRASSGPVAPGSAGKEPGTAADATGTTASEAPVSVNEATGAGTADLTAAAPSATPVRAAEIQPTKELPGQKELSERKGNWKYEAEKAPSASEKAPEKEVKPAPAAAAAAPAAAGAEEKPDLMEGPRGGSADDLKKISGVGPKLEGTLNEMGIWHFDQVASWTDTEIAWVDNRLKFKGRIVRDDWIGQAKILASGGETEFSKRKK